MNISDFFLNGKQLAQEFCGNYCVVNGQPIKLDDIESMDLNEFAYRSRISTPLHLYKYFPNREEHDSNNNLVNYSIQALEDNTVFLSTPIEFDDVYDSDINIDFEEYEHLRLIEYCKKCEIEINENQATQDVLALLVKKLWNCYQLNPSLNNAFSKLPRSEIEKLENERFILCVLNNLTVNNDFGLAAKKALIEEYSDYVAELKKTFRTACFTTSPYSQLMWGGAYADCHKGFCIEYTVLPNDESYKDVFYNLFPMIYCKTRPNMTSRLVKAKDTGFTEETLKDIYYHGALRKSIDWAFQNEWRLLLPHGFSKESNYNIKFFPITKVYIGNRMDANKRKTIIEICNNKGIPYVGVTRNTNCFEMQDCDTKCENCSKYLEKII